MSWTSKLPFKIGPGSWRSRQRSSAAWSVTSSSSKVAKTPRLQMFVVLFANGAPGRTRTCYLKIRSLALYPDELRARAMHSIGGVCLARKPG